MKSDMKVFISCVTDEFAQDRIELDKWIGTQGYHPITQEKFAILGMPTFKKLNDYIKKCHVLIHLVGCKKGSQLPDIPIDNSAEPDLEWESLKNKLLEHTPVKEVSSLTYTQLEAYLALAHDKVLLRLCPKGLFDKPPLNGNDRELWQHQKDHWEHLHGISNAQDRREFESRDELQKLILAALPLIEERLIEEGKLLVKPIVFPEIVFPNPFPTPDGKFMLRDKEIAKLEDDFKEKRWQVIYGTGGLGKTRLAVEYAWKHEKDYRAILLLKLGDDSSRSKNDSKDGGGSLGPDAPAKSVSPRATGENAESVYDGFMRLTEALDLVKPRIEDRQLITTVTEATRQTPFAPDTVTHQLIREPDLKTPISSVPLEASHNQGQPEAVSPAGAIVAQESAVQKGKASGPKGIQLSQNDAALGTEQPVATVTVATKLTSSVGDGTTRESSQEWEESEASMSSVTFDTTQGLDQRQAVSPAGATGGLESAS